MTLRRPFETLDSLKREKAPTAFNPSATPARPPAAFGPSSTPARPPPPPAAFGPGPGAETPLSAPLIEEALHYSMDSAAQDVVKNIFQCFTLDGEFL